MIGRHAEKEYGLEARHFLVPGIITVAFLIFALRLIYLQVFQAEELRGRAERSATRTGVSLAPRGQVLDRGGRVIAGVSSRWVIRGTPNEIQKHPEVLAELSRILGRSEDDLLSELESAENRNLPTDIHIGATAAQATKVAEARRSLPGVEVESRALRQVDEPRLVSHLLGYVGKPSAKLVEELRAQGIGRPAEYVGRDGLERSYEKDLMGSPALELLDVDRVGRLVNDPIRQQAVPGSRLKLGLDLDLQAAGLKALGGWKGALAALDPRTGDVLALISAPSYDVSLFEGGISRADYARLRDDPKTPLLNRAIAGTYSPGSTFKFVTALAAFQTGHLNTSSSIVCNGRRRVGNRDFRCNNHAHGISLDFEQAFEKSCNTYFINLGLKAGPEALHRAAVELGLDSPTGIDIPGERSGLVPDGRQVAIGRGQHRQWFPGDTANFSIGQGGTSFTPLGMAQAVSILFNRGEAPKPRLVSAVQGPNDEDFRPREVRMVRHFSGEGFDEFLGAIRRAMRRVIDQGTARRAQVAGLDWGGKTGSTQFTGGRRPHSWFVGAAPIEAPEIVIAVIAEESGHGGEVAAPAAAAVVREWWRKRQASDPASRIARRADSMSSAN
ncbi:MAG: penicillin-binding protein 2 [Fimbriimonadaceae bacterium]|nr:penicillin-binding protein 2 [Fimbriimonadaceae bacterium]